MLYCWEEYQYSLSKKAEVVWESKVVESCFIRKWKMQTHVVLTWKTTHSFSLSDRFSWATTSILAWIGNGLKGAACKKWFEGGGIEMMTRFVLCEYFFKTTTSFRMQRNIALTVSRSCNYQTNGFCTARWRTGCRQMEEERECSLHCSSGFEINSTLLQGRLVVQRIL